MNGVLKVAMLGLGAAATSAAGFAATYVVSHGSLGDLNHPGPLMLEVAGMVPGGYLALTSESAAIRRIGLGGALAGVVLGIALGTRLAPDAAHGQRLLATG